MESDTLAEASSKAARTAQGNHRSLPSRENSGPKTDGRKIIEVPRSEETVHNLLYYIYTGRVNLLCNDKDLLSFQPKGYPPEVDAFDMHPLSKKIGIHELEKLCFNYAVELCAVEDVLTMAKLRLDDALLDTIVSFIKGNYGEFRKISEWTGIYEKTVTCTIKRK